MRRPRAAAGTSSTSGSSPRKNGLLDQARVDIGNDRRRMFSQAKLHVLELRLGHEEIAQFFEQLIQLGRMPVQLNPSGIAEEIVQDFAQARGLPVNGVEPGDQSAVGGILRDQ